MRISQRNLKGNTRSVYLFYIFLRFINVTVRCEVNAREKETSLDVVFLSYGIWPAYLMTSIPFIGPGYDVALTQVNQIYADEKIRFRLIHVASGNVKACPDQPAFVDDVSRYVYNNISTVKDVYGNTSRHTKILPILLYAGCFEFDTLPQLAREWNMLSVLTGLTFEGFRNRDRYPTSIALGHFNYQNYVSAVNALLQLYGWYTVCLLYDVSQQIPFSYNVYKKLDSSLRNLTILALESDDASCNRYQPTSPGSTSGCFRTRRVQLFTYAHNASMTVDYGSILADIALNCRIVIISSTPSVTREILIQAHWHQQTNQEYVWISVELPENPLGLTRWQSLKSSAANVSIAGCENKTAVCSSTGSIDNNNSNKDALAAFSTASLLQVINCIEHDRNMTNTLRSRFMNLTKERYNVTYKPDTRPTESTMTAFSAVHMIAAVINATMSNLQPSTEPPNDDTNRTSYEHQQQWPLGRLMADKFLGHEFADGAKGQLFVDNYGERQVPICVAIFDPLTKDFTKVQVLDHHSPFLRNIVNVTTQLTWKTSDGNAPPNEPVCGFRGQKCTTTQQTDLIIALVTVSGIFCVGLLAAACIIRQVKKNGWSALILAEARWRVDLSQLTIGQERLTHPQLLTQSRKAVPNPLVPASSMRFSNAREKHQSNPLETMHDIDPVLYLQKHSNNLHKLSVFYKGVRVWARVYFLQVADHKSAAKRRVAFPLAKTSRLLNQVWQITHQHLNLNTLNGVYWSPLPSGMTVIVLTDFCQRGSVQDLLSSSVRLDWEMLTSLLTDLTQAVWIVHSSPLLRHGHLRPEVCLIDKRLSLKLDTVGIYDILSADRRFAQTMDHRTMHNIPDLVIRPRGEAVVLLNKESLEKWTAPELHGFLHSTHCSSMTELVSNPLSTAAADMYALGRIFDYLLKSVMGHESLAKQDSNQTDPTEPNSPAQRVPGTNDFRTRTFTVDRQGMRNHFRSKRIKGRMQLYTAVSECLNVDPSKRPTIQRIRNVMQNLRAGHSTGQNVLEVLMKRIGNYTTQLEEAVAERSHELLNERRLCDELLREMLPVEIIRKLRLGEEINPESYSSVSVMFSYLSGFSEFSTFHLASPFTVIAFLNELFGQYDEALSVLRVYKVETVGDSYMVASGLPETDQQHAWNLCQAGCALRRVFQSVLHRHLAVDLRCGPEAYTLEALIGINSGACVAGVVGLKRPRYCLFGDTVNTASRIAACSEPGRIQISCRTYQYLLATSASSAIQPLVITERGSVYLKGKGNEMTYWLDE
ncbi:atrial natriuretic peptide receptor 2-like [Paramacrobiotus metropolitanus]|uniref:atrial natriuretic peptide receptor 2-like n=1 Tax=Paramacrobiotus metropolitanus TaxID=2943436 RepID=UPI0024461D9E|nr:atrial natriuretic peptide receptor 2-like [Paramacrobiotus metropolitanus]